jgi:hypothetical protein
MRRNGFRVALLTLALWAVPTVADATIYWHSFGGSDGRIGRAANDGSSSRNDALVTQNYFGAAVASDGTYVYWGEGADSGPNHIGRANLDGTGDDHFFIPDAGGGCPVLGVEVDATRLYWISSRCEAFRVMRAPRDGSGTQEELLAEFVCGIAIDGTYLYWSEAERYIGRSKLDGTDPDPTWIDLGQGNSACGLAVNAAHVYWTLRQYNGAPGDRIGRTTIDGAPAGLNNSFITGVSFLDDPTTPSAIALDDTYVYWTNQVAGAFGTPSSSSIGRAALDSSDPRPAFIPNVMLPVGVDVLPEPKATPPPPPPPEETQTATLPGCFAIAEVTRDQRERVPGGYAILETRQVEDPAKPLTLSVRRTGPGKIRSVSYAVNGRPVRAGTIAAARRAFAASGAVPVPQEMLRIGSRGPRNKIVATVTLAGGQRVVLTQYMIVLQCHTPVNRCTRLADERTMRCRSRTPLGGRKVTITALRTETEVATGRATVTRGRYTTTLSSNVALSPGTYLYKHTVTTEKPRQRYYMIRKVRVS